MCLSNFHIFMASLHVVYNKLVSLHKVCQLDYEWRGGYYLEFLNKVTPPGWSAQSRVMSKAFYIYFFLRGVSPLWPWYGLDSISLATSFCLFCLPIYLLTLQILADLGVWIINRRGVLSSSRVLSFCDLFLFDILVCFHCILYALLFYSGVLQLCCCDMGSIAYLWPTVFWTNSLPQALVCSCFLSYLDETCIKTYDNNLLTVKYSIHYMNRNLVKHHFVKWISLYHYLYNNIYLRAYLAVPCSPVVEVLCWWCCTTIGLLHKVTVPSFPPRRVLSG